jgi:predicted permease
VAICAALVAWSLLFLRSLGQVHRVEPGFDPTGVLLASIVLDRDSVDAARGERILTEWTQRVAASPGVQSAGVAVVVPLSFNGREDFDVSLPDDPGATRHRISANRITPGWFETVRMPLAVGRDFTWDDRPGAAAVAIVNQTLARQLWNGDALGRRLLLFGEQPLEIVGIARDSKYLTLGEAPRPVIYLPLRQQYFRFLTLHVRTSDAKAAAAVVADTLRQLVPGVSADVTSMSDAVAVAVLPAQIGATSTGVFGLLAVGLATFGVYGLVSFGVLQRRREIAIRRAIGATPADIVRLVVRHHAALIGVGLTLGLAAGVAGATVLRAFLTGVAPLDPLAVAGTIALVAGAAVTASAVPALRATRGSPIAGVREP